MFKEVFLMGLFNFFSEWQSTQYEKKIANAEAKGHCPDCNGKGFLIPGYSEFFYAGSYDCTGCNGSGAFTDWAMMNQTDM
jgi:DnaJ-class molecular chaperone